MVNARARIVALPAAFALACALGGCGGTSGTSGTRVVESFAAVEVGSPQLQIAADGTSAVLRVQTDPPTVCAVAYGKTAALGSIANDPEMGGTAISRHVVLLGGLSPNTTYRYLLTATDARGQVFQTPTLATFRTTAQATGAALGRDVAVGAKVVAVSSQWSSAYRAAYAVDGNLASEWASAGDGDRAFITIELARPTAVDGVAFLSRAMSDGSSITRSFAVVVDGKRRYGPFPAGNTIDPRVARVDFTGRRLRFEVVSSTGGNTGAAEIEVLSRGG